jgi:hypothetical protein
LTSLRIPLAGCQFDERDSPFPSFARERRNRRLAIRTRFREDRDRDRITRRKLRFIGITDVASIIVQKTLAGPEIDGDARAVARRKAEELAKNF